MIAATEYELLTEDAGLLERPGHAVLRLEGGEAAEFLQGQVTNDVEALEPGQGCYAALLDHKGKLRTDMRVLRLAPEEIQVDTDGIGRAVLEHNFEMYSLGRDVRSSDVTDGHAVLSLIGPGSESRLDAVPGESENDHVRGEHGLYVRTLLGIDVICAAADADAARSALGVEAVTEEAAELRRIEAGLPRLGRDMDSSTIPQEAGLNERAVSFTKGCYVGQETVARLFYKGKPNRHLRGLRLGAPAAHADPIMLGEKQVGAIGSAGESPALGHVALALVRREAEPGSTVTVGDAEATVVELPFGDG